MRRKIFLNNKRGDENLLYSSIIFIILNLVIFSSFLYFVHDRSTGAAVYEEFYAKQIVLLINSAEPSTEISLDFEKGIEFAEKNGINLEDSVNQRENEIIVKLSRQGYGINHFSDYEIDFDFDEKNLILKIN